MRNQRSVMGSAHVTPTPLGAPASTSILKCGHRILSLSLLFLGLSLHSLYAQNSATQATLLGSSNTSTINNNEATVVDPNLTLSANGNITDFTVSITDSYTSGDVLGYTGSLPSGITASSFDANTRSIRFTGTASASVWEEFLRRVTIRTTSAICFPESRKVSFTVGNKFFNPLNNHFYEFNSTNRTWTDAFAFANNSSYFGRRGYLVTITDEAENGFVWKIANTMAWLGNTDEFSTINDAVGFIKFANQTASEGRWHWVSGPEKGTVISTSNTAMNSGIYTNWLSGEPNNSGSEHYGHIFGGSNVPGWGQSGKWNDFPNSQSLWTVSTIIEYGDMPGDVSNSTLVHTRNIFVNNSPSGTISGGNVTVCSGTNSTTLTLSGFTGTVARWEYSVDNFLTTPVTVANTSSSLTVSNITTTRYYRAIINTTGGANCSNLATSSTPIFVAASNGGNVIAENASICPGGQANLTLFGNTGNVLKWQVSTSSTFSSSVTDINQTATTIQYTLPSTGTYYFRAQVQNGSCGSPVFSGSVTQTVGAGTPPVGGLVSSASHCSGSNSGSLTLSGHTGTVQKWQFSTDGGIVWTDVASTSTTLNYTGVSSSRLYRAVLTNGSCGTVTSTPGSVVVLGGTTFTWLGAVGAQSTNASNWQCNNIPSTGSDVVISPTAGNDIQLQASMVLGNINFSHSGRKIILGNHDLTVVSITGGNANNFIQTTGTGRLRMLLPNGATRFYPVGIDTYTPLQITNRTGNTDQFSVRVFNEVLRNGTTGTPLGNARVQKTWIINKDNPNGGSGVDFQFNWNSGEVAGVLGTPALFHFENGSWVKQTGSSSSTATSLTYTGYTGTFSPFAIGSAAGVLPVVWNSFTATLQGDQALLEWSTASESNTQRFEVEKSVDGRNWTTIHQTPAAGWSNTIRRYHHRTESLEKGKYFFRIQQFDLDGKRSVSETKTIFVQTSANASFVVYPNPVVGTKIQTRSDEKGEALIYNAQGALILRKFIQQGNDEIEIGNLPAGMYQIICNGKSSKFFVK
jgi:hypothetical protein